MSSGMGAATKRRFVGLAYFPYGGDVASSMGLAGQSPDVEHMEVRASQNSYAEMLGHQEGQDRLTAVTKFADWYFEATVAAVGMPGTERSPIDHFVNFFMAADHLIRTEVQSDV